MTPAQIIEQATADGVNLSLSAAGKIKASGEQEAVSRWLPAIHEHKPAVVKALLEAGALSGDLAAVRAWLIYIGEEDAETIAEVIGACRVNPDARAYFLVRAAQPKP